MYIPTVFNEKARLSPLYKDANLYEGALKRGLLSKVKSIVRGFSPEK